jgi:myosin heavy subunit
MHGTFGSTISHRFATFARFFRPADVKDAAGIQKGETKVFLRQYAFDNVEKLRAKVMTTSSVKIQAAARRFIFRCRYARTLRFAVKVQACARHFLARKIMIRFRENKFATVVQAFVRWSLARLKFVARKAAALLVQSIFRGYIARKNYKLLYEKLKEEEKKNESAIYEKLEEEEKKNNSAIFIQCMYRISVARQRSSRIQALKELKAKSKKAQLEGKAQQSNGNLNRTVQSQRYMELKAAKSKKAALEGKAQQSNGNLNRTVSSQRYKELKAAKAMKAQKLEEKPQQPKGKLNSNSRSLLGL